MAYKAEDDKQLNAQGQAQQPGQSSSGGIAGSGVGGGAVSTSPNAGGPAGVGAGGQGAWTNIQSYLTANKGNTGTADYMNKEVGKAFETEKQGAQSQADTAKSQAKSSVESASIGQDKASQMLEEASKGGAGYQGAVQGFQGALNANYSGPQNFAYTMGQQAQDYGQGLQGGQQWNAMKQGLYNKAAGGRINSGQLALQSQLDSNNQAVESARQNLLNQYAGLQSAGNDLSASTNQALQDYQKQFEGNKASLKDFLQQSGQGSKGNIDKAVDAFNAEEAAKVAAGPQWQSVGQTGFAPYGLMMNRWADHGLLNQFNTSRRDIFGFDPFYDAKDAEGMVQTNYNANKATEQNVGGVEGDRNRYNAVAEALGLGKINSEAPVQHGSYQVNPYTLSQATNYADKSNWRNWDYDRNSGKYFYRG